MCNTKSQYFAALSRSHLSQHSLGTAKPQCAFAESALAFSDFSTQSSEPARWRRLQGLHPPGPEPPLWRPPQRRNRRRLQAPFQLISGRFSGGCKCFSQLFESQFHRLVVIDDFWLWLWLWLDNGCCCQEWPAPAVLAQHAIHANHHEQQSGLTSRHSECPSNPGSYRLPVNLHLPEGEELEAVDAAMRNTF